MFEFESLDSTDCGQVAAATLLAHHGLLPPEPASLAAIKAEFPPDNFFGLLGTSRPRMEAACLHWGLRLREIRGEAQLVQEVSDGVPVLVLLRVPYGELLGLDVPAWHWTLVWLADATSVYLSNYGEMPWPEFRQRWKSWISALGGMAERGLVGEYN